MNKLGVISTAVLSGLLVSGCALREVRSKSKFGPEFRHQGSQNTNSVRWYAQQGFEFKWDNGLSTGITYRRRDTDNGNGDNDNGVWVDFSFPIWRAKKKPDATARRIEALERRLARLEAEQTHPPQERVARRSSDSSTHGTH